MTLHDSANDPIPAPATQALAAYEAFRQILSPRSVVMIGASDRPGTMPAAAMENLRRHGFSGSVHVVNPNRDTVYGHRSYPRVFDLPEVPDTAVVLTGAGHVAGALTQAADFGIRSAIVVAAGFNEGAAGADGAAHTRALQEAVSTSGIRVLGPNTTGVLNALDGYVPKASLNHPADLVAGDLAIVGQSGAMSNALTNRAVRSGLGVGYLVATGNQIDLDVWDAADYVLRDSRIRSLLLMLESVGDVAKMRSVAATARELGKPIACLKLGTSDIGRAVVSNHSGALAGAAEVQKAALAREGVVTVTTLDELCELGALFQHWGPPEAAAREICILSTSGGDAAMGADVAERVGLRLPPPSPATAEMVGREFSFASAANPFDTTAEFLGRPGLFRAGLEAFLADPAFDAAVLSVMIPLGLFTADLQDDVASAVTAGTGPRRLAMALRSGPGDDPGTLSRLFAHGIPVFEGIETAVRAVADYDRSASLRRAATGAERPAPPSSAEPPVGASRTYWLDRAALAEAGVRFNQARLVDTAEAAVEAAEELGYPVVLKLSTAGSGHKLKSGGVRLFLTSQDAVAAGARDLLTHLVPDRAAGVGLVVERQVSGIAELFVGAHRDPELGPFLIVGAGGTWTEAMRDVAYVPLPGTDHDITEALTSTRLGRGLAGHGVPLGLLAEAAGLAAAWFEGHPEVTSLDLNPMLVLHDGGVVAVDARLALGPDPTT